MRAAFRKLLLGRRPLRRRDWLTSYAQSLSERDVVEIAEVAKPDMMRLLIEHAALAAGDAFAMGILLRDGERVMPYGDRLAAAPISSLWF